MSYAPRMGTSMTTPRTSPPDFASGCSPNSRNPDHTHSCIRLSKFGSRRMLRRRDLASSVLPALANSDASAIVWNGPGLPSNLSRCTNTDSGWHANKPCRIGSPSLPTFDASGLASGIIIVIANVASIVNRPIFSGCVNGSLTHRGRVTAKPAVTPSATFPPAFIQRSTGRMYAVLGAACGHWATPRKRPQAQACFVCGASSESRMAAAIAATAPADCVQVSRSPSSNTARTTVSSG